MQELIKKLNRRYTMSMFVTNAMMYDTMNDERKEAAYLIESQAAEISELRELNIAQIKTIRTLQTKVGYYKEISEDMERELNGRV